MAEVRSKPLLFSVLSTLIVCAAVVWLAGFTRPLQADWPGDTRVVLYAIGNWKGDFLPDGAGRGGLAALHSLIRSERTLIEKDGGKVLLVNTGDLTGSKTSAEFTSRIHPGNINILRYMRFDAAALSASELPALSAQEKGDYAGLPIVSTNAVGTKTAAARTLLVPARDTTVFFGAFTGGPAGEFDSGTERLAEAIVPARGADLFVWLTEDASLSNVLRQWTPPENPYDALTDQERIARQTIVLASGAAKSRSYRTESGVYVCQMAGRVVCRFDLRYRGHELITVQQSFLHVNGAGEPASWITPDRALLEALRTSAKDRAPAPAHRKAAGSHNTARL